MRWKKLFLYSGTVMVVFLLSGYFTVNVLLKTGETVICPDIRGKNVDEAKQLVQSKGLSLSVMKYERRNDVPYNHITVQKPEANISIRKGRIVLVMVSEGPELIQVPKLVGQSVEAAEEILKSIKLEIEKTILVPSDKVGKVIVQIPGEGENVTEGKNGVILFVGTEEKRLYVMPDVKGLDLAELTNEMEKKGIKYRATYIYGRGDYFSRSKSALETSVPSRTIFKRSDEIEIRVPNGG
jgi:eukaryotic-like serine/threonine-protein kinase